MTILSKEPDGAGYYYGFYESDPRQINVQFRLTDRFDLNSTKGKWVASVGDDFFATGFATKNEAEAAAIEFLKTGRRT
jgi:hypothetical protein